MAAALPCRHRRTAPSEWLTDATVVPHARSYMQQLLPLVHPSVKARRVLLNFLSRSHLHWLYADDFLSPTVPTDANLAAVEQGLFASIGSSPS